MPVKATAPKPKRFKQVAAGEWVQPVRKGYRMKCCDCGLVHALDFRIVRDTQNRSRIQFRAFREK